MLTIVCVVSVNQHNTCELVCVNNSSVVIVNQHLNVCVVVILCHQHCCCVSFNHCVECDSVYESCGVKVYLTENSGSVR